MNSANIDAAAVRARPSRLIAEALVLGHDSSEVTRRAKAMGLPESLTRAVVSVCCREQQDSEDGALLEPAR